MSVFSPDYQCKNDNYMTPKEAWENIKEVIPKDKVIWEPFYGDGKSGEQLRELGFNVIHEREDFFKVDRGDVVVSNPPFSKKKEILEELVKRNKPFILLISASTISTQTFRRIFKGRENIQIIVPSRRIHFCKIDEAGNRLPTQSCPFECFQYCWKIGLPKELVWEDELKEQYGSPSQ